jgi:AcrR family transcriptional regulator
MFRKVAEMNETAASDDGAMPPSGKGTTTGRPPRTSREEILDAARRLIDRDGWEKLTIRKLAGEIGTSPGTLYNHVRDRDDLLVQLLNAEAEDFLASRPELPEDPRERIVAVATLMHDGLAARPWVVEVITADDLLGEAALWLVEAIVDAAIALGAGPEQAVHLYRQIWYYTAGEILIRARRAGRESQHDGATYREEVFAHLDPATHPRLAALGDRWPDLTAEDTYAEGLRSLIDGALPPER